HERGREDRGPTPRLPPGQRRKGIEPRQTEEDGNDEIRGPCPEEVVEEEEGERQTEGALRICGDALALIRPHAEKSDAERNPRNLDARRRSEKEQRHARAGDAGAELFGEKVV